MDILTYALAKKYVDKTIEGSGALKGKNCIITDISPITGGNRVTFQWTLDNGTVETDTMDVMDGEDGLGIKSVDINSSNHLIITYDDNTTEDAGELPFEEYEIITYAQWQQLTPTQQENGIYIVQDYPSQAGANEIWYPTVSASGEISWSKSASTTPPTPRNIKGETGETGAPGQDGEDGLGIKSVDINASNHLIVTYDDDTTHDAGEIQGGGGSSPISRFLENIDVDYEYDSTSGANYTIIRIYKTKCDENQQYPFVFAPNGADPYEISSYELAKKYGWLLTINGGQFDTGAHTPLGPLVQNGIVLRNTPDPNSCRPLVIDEDGMLSEAAYNADMDTLVANGAVSVVCGFMAIIKDYEKVQSSEWPSISHFSENVQRQIIGQFGNGDYAIITCEGRGYQHSDGWTIAEAQDICVKHGLKFAYNLDGGGSTETMLGFKQFNSVYEGTSGRKVPNFIVFNGGAELGKVLLHIAATKIKVNYDIGDVIDTSDIAVTAYYSDGTNANVTSAAVIDASGVDTSTAGTYQIGVSYTYNGVTDTTSIPIYIAQEMKAFKQYAVVAGTGNHATWSMNDYRAALITEIANASNIYDTNDKYLIPIPASATSVTITSPLMYSGAQFYDSSSNRVYDPGWGASAGQNTITFTAGQYAYFACNFKNADGTSMVNADVSQITAVFS